MVYYIVLAKNLLNITQDKFLCAIEKFNLEILQKSYNFS